MHLATITNKESARSPYFLQSEACWIVVEIVRLTVMPFSDGSHCCLNCGYFCDDIHLPSAIYVVDSQSK